MLKSEAFLRLLLLLTLAGNAAADHGEMQQKFEDLTVQYEALPAIALEPRAAWAYGVTPKRNRGVISLRITRPDSRGGTLPVEAALQVSAKDASGNTAVVTMRPVTVDESLIYVGEFDILNRESLTLDIAALPQGMEKPLELQLQRQFVTW